MHLLGFLKRMKLRNYLVINVSCGRDKENNIHLAMLIILWSSLLDSLSPIASCCLLK